MEGTPYLAFGTFFATPLVNGVVIFGCAPLPFTSVALPPPFPAMLVLLMETAASQRPEKLRPLTRALVNLRADGRRPTVFLNRRFPRVDLLRFTLA